MAYQIPRNVRGEGRILFIFSTKALITTGIGGRNRLAILVDIRHARNENSRNNNNNNTCRNRLCHRNTKSTKYSSIWSNKKNSRRKHRRCNNEVAKIQIQLKEKNICIYRRRYKRWQIIKWPKYWHTH